MLLGDRHIAVIYCCSFLITVLHTDEVGVSTCYKLQLVLPQEGSKAKQSVSQQLTGISCNEKGEHDRGQREETKARAIDSQGWNVTPAHAGTGLGFGGSFFLTGRTATEQL